MKNNIFQIVTALALLALLLLLTDPFMLFMPDMLGMAILLSATALLCIWAGFIMREKAHDERENIHRMNAGRVAYLLGIAVLTIGLVVQGIAHEIDPWVAAALAVMVTGKVAAHLYAQRYK